MGPVLLDETSRPSIGTLRTLFQTRLPHWRLDAKDVVIAGSVTNTARSGILGNLQKLQSTKPESDSKKDVSIPLQERLSDLVENLKAEYPGWCSHMEEFKLVSLVGRYLAWASFCVECLLKIAQCTTI